MWEPTFVKVRLSFSHEDVLENDVTRKMQRVAHPPHSQAV